VGGWDGPFTRLLMIAAPRAPTTASFWAGRGFVLTSAATRAPDPVGGGHAGDVGRCGIDDLILRQLPAMIWTTDLDLRCTFSMALASGRSARSRSIGGSLDRRDCRYDDPDHPALVAHRRALSGEEAEYRDTSRSAASIVVVEPLPS